MAVVSNDPLVAAPDSTTFLARRRSRVRPIVAALLLIVMGLLAAASVLASRPYRPAAHPRATTAPHASSGQHPDPC